MIAKSHLSSHTFHYIVSNWSDVLKYNCGRFILRAMVSNPCILYPRRNIFDAGRPDVASELQSRAQAAAAQCIGDKDPMLAATAALSLGHAGVFLILSHQIRHLVNVVAKPNSAIKTCKTSLCLVEASTSSSAYILTAHCLEGLFSAVIVRVHKHACCLLLH